MPKHLHQVLEQHDLAIGGHARGRRGGRASRRQGSRAGYGRTHAHECHLGEQRPRSAAGRGSNSARKGRSKGRNIPGSTVPTSERVTISLPGDLVRVIARLEQNRNRFIQEAARRELARRRRDRLKRSLRGHQPETAAYQKCNDPMSPVSWSRPGLPEAPPVQIGVRGLNWTTELTVGPPRAGG